MTVILVPLALLALADGLLNLPFGMGKRWLGHFLASVPGAVVDMDAGPGLFLKMAILSASLSLSGILVAWIIYRSPQNGQGTGVPSGSFIRLLSGCRIWPSVGQALPMGGGSTLAGHRRKTAESKL